MRKEELLKWVLLAFESEGSNTILLLTHRNFRTLAESNILTPSPKQERDRFEYIFSIRGETYYLRVFDREKFLLFPKALWTPELSSLNKLRELERVYKVIRLPSWIIAKKRGTEISTKKEDMVRWHLSFDDSLLSELEKLLGEVESFRFEVSSKFKKPREVQRAWALVRELESQHWARFSPASERDGKISELISKLKKRERKITEELKFESHFSSEGLFESHSKTLPSSKEELEILKSRGSREEEEKLGLLDLLPSPAEEYSEILAQLPRERMRDRYFNPHFPFTSFLELNDSRYFWASISPQYMDVDSFAHRLKEYYGSLSLSKLDSLIEAEVEQPLWRELQSRVGVKNLPASTHSFKSILDTKLSELQQKNESLNSQLRLLKEELLAEGKQPEADMLYLHSLKEKQILLGEIERTFELLNNYSKKIDSYSGGDVDFNPTLYLSIFGSKAILSKYDSLVCEALFSLNDQLNEIIFYQKEIEKVLFERLSTLHRAKKAELKLEFLAEEENLASLVFKRKSADRESDRVKEKRELELRGALELSKCNIQEEIEREKAKLSSYLGRLKELDSYPDYEEQSRQLRIRKAEFEQKVSSYREEIYALKLKAEAVEREYGSFMSMVKEEILNFQAEISEYYSSHLQLINTSVNSIWTDWMEQGVMYIEKILGRKERLVREFSEIIILELKRMHSAQDSLLEEARERKKEWERVYREMIDEFKTLGYYLSKPKPSEYYYKFLPKLNKSSLRLSPEIKDILYYKPSLEYTTPKVNELIGLSPKLLDSSEFLVIDQVWTKLTPFQEERLKEKLKREADAHDKERMEELFNKTREKINESLRLKDYSLKTLSLEKEFPLESDREERDKQLEKVEKANLRNWRELHFTTSEIKYRFRELLSQFSRKLFTLKGVEQWGKDLNISDKGRLGNPDEVEAFSEWDYFTKSKDVISMVESCAPPAGISEGGELYDIEDESYLSILEALEADKEKIRERLNPDKKSLMPTLEEWANLNLKRYREEKKKVDIIEVKEGLLALEKEIKSLKQSSGNYREACELEIGRREQLVSEIAEELEKLKEYFQAEEEELHRLFAEASDMVDLSFEKIDRELDEKKRRALELQRKQEGEELPFVKS